MIDEQYINGTYYKRYSNPDNKHLLFLLTGQSMTPRAFWDFKLPDGKTHSEYFYEAGIDVILFDPVGYGKSTEFYNYDRHGYAEQINNVTNTLTKEYQSKTILGFSTSTAPALLASTSGYFDKLMFHSPCIRTVNRPLPEEEIFETNIELLKAKRLKEFGDRIIPKTNRLPNWEEALSEVIDTNTWKTDIGWKVPGQIVRDIMNYFPKHQSVGYDSSKLPMNVMSIHGMYDYEVVKFGYEHLFIDRPDTEVRVVPNSTHFSMWENECHITREFMIEFVTR